MMVITIPDNDVKVLKLALLNMAIETQKEMTRLLDLPEWTDTEMVQLRDTKHVARVTRNAIDQIELQLKLAQQVVVPVATAQPSQPTLVGKIQSFTQRVFSQCKQSLTNKKKEQNNA
jgi:hypothetical protein